MDPNELQVLLNWLRENCAGDVELLELIQVLNAAGRIDLLLLMQDYRHPLKPAAQIQARVGSEDLEERLLVELQCIFTPVAEANAELIKARRIYENYLCGNSRYRYGDVVEDAKWPLDPQRRQQLRDLLGYAKAAPPVPFDQLGPLLRLTVREVCELILQLHERYLFLRRPPKNDESSGRTLP